VSASVEKRLYCQQNEDAVVKTANIFAANNKSGAAVYCQTPESVKRVLILGAGQAAMQVADILLHDPSCQLVGFFRR